MPSIAEVDSATSLLELAATSIASGIVVLGFAGSAVGMLTRRSRKEMEATALRQGFWGGLFGVLCLCYDLWVR